MRKRFIMKPVSVNGKELYVSGDIEFSVDKGRGRIETYIDDVDIEWVEDLDGNDIKDYNKEQITEAIGDRIWDWIEIW